MRRAGAIAVAVMVLCTALIVMWPQGDPEIRDIPFRAEPPSGHPLRMVALGTSLTARAEWPEDVAAGLGACIGAPVTLMRIAQAGAHSGAGTEMARQAAANLPDLVFIEFAINDADIRDGLSLATSRVNHHAIIQTLRKAVPGVAIVLITTNPPRGIRRLTRPMLGRYLAMYHDLAAESGAGLFDGHARWLAQGTAAVEDGLHPKPEAESALIAQPLVKMVGQGFGFDC